MAFGGCDDGDGGGGGSAGGAGGGADAFTGAGGGAGEGGMGGEGGEGGSAGMGGAGAEGGAGGEGGMVADPCVAACEALDACAQTECQGTDGMGLLRIGELCATACAGNPSFAVVSEGIASCGDRIAFARQNLPEEFDALCLDDGVPDAVPECGPFGDRIAQCMAEGRCPALASIQEATAASFTAYCNEAVAAGMASPMDLGMLVNANTPCEAPFIAMVVDQQIDGEDGPDGELGPLGGFCADGPVTAPETCEAACAVVAPCIPEGSDGEALRDVATCEYFCITTDELPTEGWGCAADADSCQAVFECFEAATPAPENCVGYAARVRACTVEACPTAAAIGDGVQGVVEAVCEAGELEAAVVDSVTDQTACAEPAIAFLVDYFVNVDPEDAESGLIATYCADGPVNAAETCEAACSTIGPCVPPESDGAILADPAVCQLSCVASDDLPSEVWGCAAMAEADGCEAVQACFPPDDGE